MERRALVTAVVGDSYRRFYDAHIRAGHARFARQLGCPLVVLTRPLVSGSDGRRALETAIRVTESLRANLRAAGIPDLSMRS